MTTNILYLKIRFSSYLAMHRFVSKGMRWHTWGMTMKEHARRKSDGRISMGWHCEFKCASTDWKKVRDKLSKNSEFIGLTINGKACRMDVLLKDRIGWANDQRPLNKMAHHPLHSRNASV